MKIIIDCPDWINEDVRVELFKTIKDICHLLSDDEIKVKEMK